MEQKKQKLRGLFKQILKEMNLDLENEHLIETPDRIAKSWINDFFCGVYSEPPKLKTFKNPGYDELIIVKGIRDFSMCAHHFVTFEVTVSIGYLPDKKLLGLSKFARVVKYFCRRPQVQERLSNDIANYLDEHLQPKFLMVVIEGRHLCMCARGIERDGKMITSAIRGREREPDWKSLKEEFLRLIK